MIIIEYGNVLMTTTKMGKSLKVHQFIYFRMIVYYGVSVYTILCYFDQPLFVAFTQIGISNKNLASVNQAKPANVQIKRIYFISVPCGLWAFRNHIAHRDQSKQGWVCVIPSHTQSYEQLYKSFADSKGDSKQQIFSMEGMR